MLYQCGDDLMQLSGAEPMDSKRGETGLCREIESFNIGPRGALSTTISFSQRKCTEENKRKKRKRKRNSSKSL